MLNWARVNVPSVAPGRMKLSLKNKELQSWEILAPMIAKPHYYMTRKDRRSMFLLYKDCAEVYGAEQCLKCQLAQEFLFLFFFYSSSYTIVLGILMFPLFASQESSFLFRKNLNIRKCGIFCKKNRREKKVVRIYHLFTWKLAGFILESLLLY